MKAIKLFIVQFFICTALLAQTERASQIPVTTGSTPCTFVATVDVGGETNICPGTALELTAQSGAGYTYQWLRDDVDIPGATSQTYFATEPGQYAVSIYTRNCRGESIPIEVTLKNDIAFDPFPDQLNICGDAFTLNAGGGFLDYNWNIGSNDSIINITQSGTFTATVLASNGCFLSDQTAVSLIDFHIDQSDISLCSGNSILLSVSGSSILNGYDCIWGTNGQYHNGYEWVISPAASGLAVAAVTDGQGTCRDSINIKVHQPSSSIVQAMACDQYSWHGNIYTQSGVFQWTSNNQYGCDSTVSLYLTIKHSSRSVSNFTACGNYFWNNHTYSTSGNYAFHTTNQVGCDSAAYLHLIIVLPTESNTVATACNSYMWNGITYTQSGTYNYHTTNVSGCDSLAVLQLTINNTTNSVTEVVSYAPYNWNGQTYVSSGTYTYITTNSIGCDSIAVLDLTIASPLECGIISSDASICNGQTVILSAPALNITTIAIGIPSRNQQNVTSRTLHYTYLWSTGDTTQTISVHPTSTTTYTLTISDGYTTCTSSFTIVVNQPTSSTESVFACDYYVWNGNIYQTSGDYTFATTNADGCDSIVNLHLNIGHAIHQEEAASACVSYNWNGQTYTQSGDYTINTGDCNSTSTLHLTINQPSYSEESIVLCNWFSYTWNGNMYHESGDYTYTTTNANGCDSVATLHLTFNQATSSETTATACGTYNWNGIVFTTSGDYTFTATNANGCDSVATLHLTINQPTSSEASATACGTYNWNGIVYTTSGDYTFTATNANGCDSIATLHLTINQPTSSETSATACGTYNWNGIVFTTSGDYTFTATNANGCDSIATLHLTIHQPTSSETSATTCGSFNWNGIDYTSSGDYTFTSTNANGCDSVATLHLTINQPTSSETSATACGTYIWNGIVYTYSGDYTFTTTNANGCDSVATLHLTIHQPTSSETSATTCGSFNWNGIDYTSSGDYTFTTTNANGCDSLATLHLTILHVPVQPGPISGPVTNLCGMTATYSIDPVAYASSYQWTLPNGVTLIAGQGTNTITVAFSNIRPRSNCNNNTSNSICVKSINQCGASSTSCISVSWQLTGHVSINGPSAVNCSQTVTYASTLLMGATRYQWTVPTGWTILTGQGTTTIIVKAGRGSGIISVTPMGNCGNASTASICVRSFGNCGCQDNGGQQHHDEGEHHDDDRIANNTQQDLDFITYPNPAVNVLNVKSDNAVINWVEIIDAKGKKMLSTSHCNNIGVAALPSGQYFIKIFTSKGTRTKGLLIMR